MSICKNKDCVFHKDKIECLLPDKQNFFVTDESGCVYSCINWIRHEDDLSKEGKQKLNEFYQIERKKQNGV